MQRYERQGARGARVVLRYVEIADRTSITRRVHREKYSGYYAVR